MTIRHEIIVSNIGIVYDGTDIAEARRTFNEYCNQARDHVGRASGESVTWLLDGEIEVVQKGDEDTP